MDFNKTEAKEQVLIESPKFSIEDSRVTKRISHKGIDSYVLMTFNFDRKEVSIKIVTDSRQGDSAQTIKGSNSKIQSILEGEILQGFKSDLLLEVFGLFQEKLLELFTQFNQFMELKKIDKRFQDAELDELAELEHNFLNKKISKQPKEGEKEIKKRNPKRKRKTRGGR